MYLYIMLALVGFCLLVLAFALQIEFSRTDSDSDRCKFPTIKWSLIVVYSLTISYGNYNQELRMCKCTH